MCCCFTFKNTPTVLSLNSMLSISHLSVSSLPCSTTLSHSAVSQSLVMSPGGVAGDDSVTLTLADAQGMLEGVTLNLNTQVNVDTWTMHNTNVSSCSLSAALLEYLLNFRVRPFLQCWMTQDSQPAQASRLYWSATIPNPQTERLTMDTMWVCLSFV